MNFWRILLPTPSAPGSNGKSYLVPGIQLYSLHSRHCRARLRLILVIWIEDLSDMLIYGVGAIRCSASKISLPIPIPDRSRHSLACMPCPHVYTCLIVDNPAGIAPLLAC